MIILHLVHHQGRPDHLETSLVVVEGGEGEEVGEEVVIAVEGLARW